MMFLLACRNAAGQRVKVITDQQQLLLLHKSFSSSDFVSKMLAVVEIRIFDTFCWVWIAGGPMAGGSTHLLPLHLHQTTLEVGAVAIAAAIEGQQ